MRFQDPNIPARRGINEFEANRRYREILENKLIGEDGFSDEQAEATVKSNYPWIARVSSALQPEIISASAKGWKLFPIAAGTKDGALTKWSRGGPGHEATDNLAQVELWDQWRPGSNWGCATGAKSGFFVVDTDSFEGWLWFMGQGLPTTYTVKTGNPDPYRLQYYFKMPAGLRVKNSASEIAPGVDVRGDGGMVLIAPSLHPSGNRYAVVEDCEIADAPAWLIDLVKDERPECVPVEVVGELTDAQRQIGLAIFKSAYLSTQRLRTDSGITSSQS